MSNYSKTTDFEAKDSLPTGDSGKIIRGAEFETEFDAISTAIATKADTAGPTFTGTLTFETISDGTIGVTAFVDEDNMASNSATLVPTQQSVKAYVDSQVTAQDLDFQADSGGALSIDLDSEALTLTGGTGIDTSGALNAVTFAIDSTVATLTGTQTLTNKTLTTPVISGNLTTNGNIDGRDVAADGTKLDGIESGATADQTAAEIRTLVEAATDSNVFTDADHTKLNGIEASADVTDTTNVTAAGALMDSELTNITAVKALNQGVATTDSPTFAGLTTTANVSFGDNDKAIFGAGSDLQIYHDGTHSKIEDAGSGDLKFITDGSGFNFQKGSSETLANFAIDGAVTLYYNNSAKLATTSTGIDVTGTVTADGLTVDGNNDIQINRDGVSSAKLFWNRGVSQDAAIELNANEDLTISVDDAGLTGKSLVLKNNSKVGFALADGGDISFYEDTGTTAKLTWDASAESLNFADNGKAVFGASSDLQISHNGATGLFGNNTGSLFFTNYADDYDVIIQSDNGSGGVADYFRADGSAGSAILYNYGSAKLATTSTGIDVTGTVTADGLTVDGFAQVRGNLPYFYLIENDTTDLNTGFRGGDGQLQIRTFGDNLSTSTNRFAIDHSTGDISFYEDTGTTAKLFWDSSAESLNVGSTQLNFSTVKVQTGSATDAAAGFNVFTSATGDGYLLFSDGNVGNQSYSGQVRYNHASDFMAFGTAGGVERMRINSTGIDVTGTVTADEIVLGNNDKLIFQDSGGINRNILQFDTSNNIIIGGAGAGVQAIELKNNSAKDRLTIAANGDISFYEDTGTTAKFFWDASAEALGVGTNSPATQLHVNASSGDVEHRIEAAGSGNDTILSLKNLNTGAGAEGHIRFMDGTITAGSISYLHNAGGVNDAMAFYTASTERMRLDASGNLLVGKSSSSFTTAGVELAQGGTAGKVQIMRSSGALTVVNTTNDGSAISIYKGTSAVGSIGTAQSSIYIGGTSNGAIYFNGTTDIRPWNTSTQANLDNTMDLGSSSARFKDLHLSGDVIAPNIVASNGVFLGGTGSANKLDDYEEGTFSPTLYGASSAGTTTYATVTGTYTKVGNRCTINFVCSVTATTGTGSLRLGGLPFSSSGENTTALMINNLNWGGGTYLMAYVGDNDTFARVYYIGDDNTWQQQQITNEAQHFIFTLTYQTA